MNETNKKVASGEKRLVLDSSVVGDCMTAVFKARTASLLRVAAMRLASEEDFEGLFRETRRKYVLLNWASASCCLETTTACFVKRVARKQCWESGN